MVIILFKGDIITKKIFYNGSYDDAYEYASKLECSHYIVVSEQIYNLKYK